MVNSVGPSSPLPNIQPVVTSSTPNTSGISTIDQALQDLQGLGVSSADQPMLALALYFQTVASSLREQMVQDIISSFADKQKRKEMYQAAASQTVLLGGLITGLEKYKGLQSQLENLNLDQAAADIASSANTYNNAIDNSKATDLNNAIDAYRADPSSDNLDALNNAVAAYNAYVGGLNPSIDSLNTTIDSWNQLVQQAGTIIDSMNSIREGLGLPDIAKPSTLSDLPEQDLYVYSDTSGHVDLLSSYTAPTWTTPPAIDETVFVIETKILVLANIIHRLEGQQDEDDNKEATVDDPTRRTSSTNLVGGSGASTALTTIDQSFASNNPWLGSDLSRQGLDAFFNNFGVPLGSALVDQIGALYHNFKQVNDLISASDANQILSNGSLNVEGGGQALRVASALGNLSVTQSLGDGTTLPDALRALLGNIPEFNALSPEQQSEFITGLAGEFNGSLLRASLQELGIQLGMPGLLPQILANLAGLATNDPLGSFQSQLFYASILSQNLPTSLGISQQQADSIASDALRTSLDNQSAITQQSIVDAIVAQIGKGAADQSELHAQVAQQDTIARNSLNNQLESQRVASSNAYSDSLSSSLQSDDLATQQQIDTLVQQLLKASIEQFGEIATTALRSFNVSQEQIAEFLSRADLAAQQKSAPLGGFVSNRVLSLDDIHREFVNQTRKVLAPVVYDQQALYVAENYGRLIFTSENSIVNRLRSTERAVVKNDSSNQVDRLFEEYRSATATLRDPMNSPDAPLSNGETLLLSGMASGPSTLGILSTDKTLDPAGKQYKRPVDIPI